ncbi:MAG TPA: glycosyltransferase family 39 protein [Candidatus Methylomirabilis sp.]|nr:glycosyltransferase family 39 protein [Candidatus Methylomirabilis sp.]
MSGLGALRSIDRLAEALRARAERYPWVLLLGFSILYFAVTALDGSRRLVWYDELFTYHISRLPTFSHIWRALSTGIEQIPPLFWLITRVSTHFLGDGPVGIRLPEMIGFWVMTLGLYRFVARRSGALYGCLAMVFPLATGAARYTIEGRPYGLLLAFSILALLAWRASGERGHRALAILGLAASLVAALGTHYYAVLLLPALVVAELVRSARRRRLDLPVLAAISLPLLSLLLYLPLIRGARTYAEHFWARAQWKSLAVAYRFLLDPALGPLVILLALAAVLARPRPETSGAVDGPGSEPPPEEVAAAAGFLAIPLVGMAVAKLATNAFTTRYVLTTVIGASILFAWAAHRLLRGRALPAFALLLVLGGSFGIREYVDIKGGSASAIALARNYDFLESAQTGSLPIVVVEAHVFLQLLYYAPPAVADRLLYVSDFRRADRESRVDTTERNLLELRHQARVRVQEYDAFVAGVSGPFLIYGNQAGRWRWLTSALESDGIPVRLIASATRRRGTEGGRLLFLAEPPR